MKNAVAGLKDNAALAAYVKSLVAPGKLQEQPTTARRAHPALPTTKLFAQASAGQARPIHSVEAAFLVAALAQARGETPTFVTETAGIQTPLLLSRTRLAVKLADGTVLEPFADKPMQKPQTVPPDQATAWWLVLRAHAERMAFDFKAANADFAAAEALWPNQPIVAFARAISQLDQGLTETGLPACEAVLARQDDPLAALSLVQMALQLEQPVKAWTLAENVAKNHPDLAEAHLALGVLNLQRSITAPDAQKVELTKAAKTELEKARELNPKVTGVMAALAQLQIQQKDMEGAEKLLREGAANKDPDSALMLAEILRGQGKSEDAVKVLQEAGTAATDERAAVSMAQNQIALKKPEEAMETVDAALKMNPASRQLMMVRAELLRTEGKLGEAAEALKPLTESGPDAEKAKLLQAQLYLQNRDTEKALAILEPAQKAKPTDRETTMLLLIAYAVTNAPEKSEALAKEAIAQKVLVPLDVAGVWLQAQMPEKAQKLLEGLMEQPQPEVDQIALLAMLYTASGKKDEAMKLRDTMAKKLGDKGQTVKDAVDKAVEAAEGELAKMKADQKAGKAPELP